MKKYSKLIALLTVAIFVLGFAGVAFAAEKDESAAGRLMTLGIVEGDPSGDLRLDDTITRAEFAKIAVMAAGMEDAAGILAGATPQFTDVKANAWYTGWINVASAQGLIKGDGDGTFRPNDEITGAEVVTVLLRLLGYNDNLSGSWPVDYIVKAADLGITEDANFVANTAAVRGDVFIMADSTLGEDTVKWVADDADFESKLETLLASSYEGNSDDGVVGNVNWDDGVMQVDVVTVNSDDEVKVTTYDVAENAVVTGAPSILAMAGSEFDYILNDDDEIIYAAATSTDAVTDDEMTWDDASGVITIDKEDYDVLDGFKVALGTGDNVDFTALDAVGLVDADGDTAGDKVTVILEDGDAKWAVVTSYNNATTNDGDIIDEIDGDKVFTVNGSGDFEYDEDDDFVFVKNGEIVDFDALAEGDLVYAIADARGLDYLVVASDMVVVGDLEEANADGDEITVDGEDYDVYGTSWISTDGGDNFSGLGAQFQDKDLFDETIKLMLSPTGLVAVAVSDVDASSAGLYGIILGAEEGSSISDDKVKIFTAEGDKVVYVVDKEFTNLYNDANTNGELDSGELYTDTLIEYELNNDGEVKAVTVINDSYTSAGEEDNRFDLGSWYRVNDSTVFFAKDGSEDDDWIVTNWDAFKDIEDTVYADISDGVIDAVAYVGEISDSDNVGVIAGNGINSDGFYYDVIVEGEKTRYNVDSNDADAEDYVKKNFVTFDLSDGDISTVGFVYDEAIGDFEVDTPSEVTKVGADYVEVDGNYYYTDSDTMVVDLDDGSSPKVVSRPSRGDEVVIYGDDKGVVEVILIINTNTTWNQ